MKNITKAITFLGAIVLLIAIIQWFFIYPDTSQLLFGGGLGCVILIFAYIYDWMKLIDEGIENLNYRVDSLQFPPKGK